LRKVFFALIFSLASLSAGVIALPAQASAASFSFTPSSGSESVGSEFTVKAVVNPGVDKVNAGDGTIQYDPTMLSLQSFSKDGSVFTLWTSEPVISKAAGTIKFSGGTPSAFSTPGTFLILKFKGLKVGTAKLSYTDGSILAADGKGTDVYSSGSDASFDISDAANAGAGSPTADTSASDNYTQSADTGPPPIAPIISSLSFPDESGWYATSSGAFTWNLPIDATAVRTLLSSSTDATPSNVLKPMASSSVVSGINDGTSYFYVQVKNPSGWGDIAKRKVQIDTVPPADFNITLQTGVNGAVPKLAFKAEDALSGVDHYEIYIASSSVATISASDVVDGTYPVPPQGGGSQVVTIRAYDKAGNMTESSRTLDLPKVESKTAQTADASANTCAPASPWSFDRILTILFALVIGGLVAWIRFTKKAVTGAQSNLLTRIAEINDRNDRVFTAMREEFEEMVTTLNNRPYPTAEERDFLEKIKEVLDLSEEVVDTGMENLKKFAQTGNDIVEPGSGS
jgi:hypothetical protein